MRVKQAKRLKEVERENARLRKAVADLQRFSETMRQITGMAEPADDIL